MSCLAHSIIDTATDTRFRRSLPDRDPRGKCAGRDSSRADRSPTSSAFGSPGSIGGHGRAIPRPAARRRRGGALARAANPPPPRVAGKGRIRGPAAAPRDRGMRAGYPQPSRVDACPGAVGAGKGIDPGTRRFGYPHAPILTATIGARNLVPLRSPVDRPSVFNHDSAPRWNGSQPHGRATGEAGRKISAAMCRGTRPARGGPWLNSEGIHLPAPSFLTARTVHVNLGLLTFVNLELHTCWECTPSLGHEAPLVFAAHCRLDVATGVESAMRSEDGEWITPHPARQSFQIPALNQYLAPRRSRSQPDGGCAEGRPRP